MAKQPRAVHSPARLGRGLSSLISGTVPGGRQPAQAEPALAPAPQPPPADGGAAPRELPVDDIRPNPYQPRRHFDAASIAELSASIARQGILQPLLVVPSSDPDAGGPYVLVAGERRLRAARDAGLTRVPCLVREATNEQLLEWSLIENIQRADLNPIERAEAYRRYMDEFHLTQAQVAERTGEARATIANHLRILDLADPVRELILAGELTFGHARALAALAGRDGDQRRLARRITTDGLSVRQAEALVAALVAGRPQTDEPAKAAPRKPPYLLDLEQRLSEAVGTRVTIRPGRAKGSGRIVVAYYGLDDFDRIAERLGLKPEA